MTEQTRKRVLRYGIPIDLVIVATGIGMLVPSPWLIVTSLFAATATSVWKGGWRGGLLAFALSVLMLFLAFPGAAQTVQLLFFVVASICMLALPPAVERVKAGRAAGNGDHANVARMEKELAKREARARKERAKAEAQQRAETERLVAAERKRAENERAERERAEVERKLAEDKRKRAEDERTLAENERARLAKELEARERELQEKLAAAELQRAEVERIARARAEAERARLAKELEDRGREERERLANELAEREVRERELQERLEAAERERAESERRERERAEAEAERLVAAERQRAEEERLERERVEAERARLAKELEEREASTRERQERLARERAEVDAERARLASEAAPRDEQALAGDAPPAEPPRDDVVAPIAMVQEREEDAPREREPHAAARQAEADRLDALEREKLAKEFADRELRRSIVTPPPSRRPPVGTPAPPPAPVKVEVSRRAESARRPAPKAEPSLFERIADFFTGAGDRRTVNMVNRRVTNNAPRTQRSTARRPLVAPPPRKPRVLLVERRRGTADTAVPKLLQRGIEVEVVERWVDTVDEMFRFKPDALLLDVDHPEFDLIHRTIAEQNPKLPIVFTGTVSSSAPAAARQAPWVIRPYDLDELARIAQQAMTRPAELLAPRNEAVPAAAPASATAAAPRRVDTITPAPPKPERKITNDEYEVLCYHCRIEFNGIEADWCSCLTRERTLVCTNCLTCFCKASAAYKEKFWIEAPPRLFERKNNEAQRQQQTLPANPPAARVQRPLVLCVDDDAQILAIVAKICTNLGYGFISAGDGQTGLALARDYRPDLILSDAFMPKLDGREMCRILKEEGMGESCRTVVMTGLYTDTKYRSEAVKRFHIDDYIAKPVAVTDLINLLQKHLEGVTGAPLHDADAPPPPQRDAPAGEVGDVPLAQVLGTPPPPSATLHAAEEPAASDGYEVCCFQCGHLFDATTAEWCHCVGRDNTLVCSKCNGCFCKAPASYKERFWIDAPPSLFERKMIGSKRSLGSRANPAPSDVKRPLILLVEDDENVQLIVRTVVTNMGYGFVVGANGQEGLLLAREYEPELILSDAFMPKLDGREMCRLLKEDPRTSASKAIIMTGLYTDRKYRNEALSYFKVDDYVAKPLAVDDLIKLFKKHLPTGISTVN